MDPNSPVPKSISVILNYQNLRTVVLYIFPFTSKEIIPARVYLPERPERVFAIWGSVLQLERG